MTSGISRLKGGADPVIVSANRKWRGRSKDVEGKRLRDVLSGLRREELDVMVDVRFKRRTYKGVRRTDTHMFRVVGVRDKETQEYHLFITTIPFERLDSKEIANTYRLRWQIELLFKELKTHYRLDQMPSTKRHIPKLPVKFEDKGCRKWFRYKELSPFERGSGRATLSIKWVKTTQ